MAKNTPSPKNIDILFEFLRFTHAFRSTERVILLPDKEQWENDAEHSYQLAMFAWYIIEHDKLDFDKDKVIKLCLVHDLVETYAGDTYVFADSALLASKKEREAESANRIASEFPGFEDLHNLIQEYESMATKESKFVHALDKLIPVLNICIDNGRLWPRKNITMTQLLEIKKDIPELAPEIAEYYEQMISLLRENSHWFGQEQ